MKRFLKKALDIDSAFDLRVKMAPRLIDKEFEGVKIPKKDSEMRKSAVVCIMEEGPDLASSHILLTLRSSHLKHHGAQWSFPGGKIEAGETAYEAALRECEEEVGIEPTALERVGELSPLYVNRSNNLITPYLCTCSQLPALHLNPDEVEAIQTIPLKYFLDVENRRSKIELINGIERVVPYWVLKGYTIPLWGATAMILCELCERIRMAENED